MQKRIIPLLGCLLFSLSVHSVLASDINKLLQCSSELLYNRYGTYDELTAIADSIQKTIECPDKIDDIEDYIDQCNGYINKYKKSASTTALTYKNLIDNLDISPAIKTVLLGFANPKYNCHKIGFYGSAALVSINWGTGVDFAYCTSTMGRRWVESRPFFEHGGAAGGYLGAGVSYGWDNNLNYSPLPVHITMAPVLEVDGGSYIGGKVKSSWHVIPNSFGAGIGIGAKASASAALQVNITTIPLSTNYKPMVSLLEYSDLNERDTHAKSSDSDDSDEQDDENLFEQSAITEKTVIR